VKRKGNPPSPAGTPREGAGRAGVTHSLVITDDGLVKVVRYLPSPNHDERPPGTQIELLVIHTSACRRASSAFRNHRALHQSPRPRCAPVLRDDRRSPGFGAFPDPSRWRNDPVRALRQPRLACRRVGVARSRPLQRLFNWDRARSSDETRFEDAQYETLAELILALRARYPVADVAGHSDIAPGRKTIRARISTGRGVAKCWVRHEACNHNRMFLL